MYIACAWADCNWRYEVMRPLVLFGDRTATQRARETHTHPDTVRALRRLMTRRPPSVPTWSF